MSSKRAIHIGTAGVLTLNHVGDRQYGYSLGMFAEGPDSLFPTARQHQGTLTIREPMADDLFAEAAGQLLGDLLDSAAARSARQERTLTGENTVYLEPVECDAPHYVNVWVAEHADETVAALGDVMTNLASDLWQSSGGLEL